MNPRVHDLTAVYFVGKMFIWFVDAFNYAIKTNPRFHELKAIRPDVERLRDALERSMTTAHQRPKPVLRIVKAEKP